MLSKDMLHFTDTLGMSHIRLEALPRKVSLSLKNISGKIQFEMGQSMSTIFI